MNKTAKRQIRAGLIGYGTAGRDVAKGILAGNAGDCQLTAVLVRNSHRYSGTELPAGTLTDSIDAFFNAGLDVVIETAGHDAVRHYTSHALSKGCDVMVVSVGAFSDQALLNDTLEIARQQGKRVIIPSAAIAGLDRLSAATLGHVDSITLTTRKPVKAWRGTFAEEILNLDTISEPTLVFEGNARESSRLFPESVNVSAALSLAGIGFESTTVRVLVDPTIEKNIHEVSAQGVSGEVRIEVQNTPSPGNPKTGYIVAMSILSSLRQLTSPMIFS
ncbi:aspartate dehydrogenase [Vreelandella olivaria]|uniref:aspartate dehydrogenase n=1 Tax=Vreelandella olivaria TaxID=390919 RepID=UPI00201E9C65|nr:aspartate dehydrogenase [Halomonas olivaria]